ncbi:MAG TPA: histidine phosphatase family protein, partial [Pyrinomonadaceae bacterium]|nr:histidine phosphatase family protein [Pyrinomonadaceae bacterium]
MKKLLLLRHAKSSWDDASLPDFERPLNERGRRAAPLMGEFMRRQKIRPDLVICSPARRTRETIARVLEAAGMTTEVRYDERIYEASVQAL